MAYTIYSNLPDIFELEDVNNNQVILKVKADTPLKVAKFPFVSGNWNYITVTRGKDHTLTVIKDDGKTFSFSWGERGYTLVSDSLNLLKANVQEFIRNNDIILDYDGTAPTKASVFYNSWYKSWQLSTNKFNYWNPAIESADEMIEYCKRFVKAEWNKTVAVTGIDIWEAINPVFSLK